MRKFLIDTEFIRASKDRVHFLEVAVFDLENGNITDFHYQPHLNNWEKKYFHRALSGAYGKRTKSVFEAVDTLYRGDFNMTEAKAICNRFEVAYDYMSNRNFRRLERLLNGSTVYAWDTSNDRELIPQLRNCKVEMVDVQKRWKQKFGGNQLSLSDAYKTMLYNTGAKDDLNILEHIHFACADVLLLNKVVDFIAEFEGELQSIPISLQVQTEKIEKNNLQIERWIVENEQLTEQMEVEAESLELTELSRKLIATKRKIAKATKRNEQLLKLETYEKPWW